MEIVGAVASATQLIAYSQCAADVLVRLYKEVQNGPDIWKEQASNLRHLLGTVQRLQNNGLCGGIQGPDPVISLLVEISRKAQETLTLVLQAQEPGLLGIRWTSFRIAQGLEQAFDSLRTKRDLLHFAIAQDTHKNSTTIRDDIARMNQQTSENRSQGAGKVEETTPQIQTVKIHSILTGPSSGQIANNGWGPKVTVGANLDLKTTTDGKGAFQVSGNHDGVGGQQHGTAGYQAALGLSFMKTPMPDSEKATSGQG